MYTVVIPEVLTYVFTAVLSYLWLVIFTYLSDHLSFCQVFGIWQRVTYVAEASSRRVFGV